MGIVSLSARRAGRIGLVALLGLTFALVTVAAGHARASTWQKAGATEAKKKCKKKHHSAATSKKKKCKKKKNKQVVTPPVVTPPRGPIDRIVLTWSGAADLDAHAWSGGLHDGWSELNTTYELEIPGTSYENSAATPNRERVTELNPNPSIRPLTFGFCYYAGPGSTDAGQTDVHVTSVFSNGQSSTAVVPTDYGEALVNTNTEGGSPDPVGDWCPV